MNTLLLQIAITISAFLFSFLIYRSNLSYKWKILVLLVVLLEGILHLFFWIGRFNLFLSLLIVFFSSFFLQQTLYPFREKYMSYFDLTADSFFTYLWLLFKKHFEPLTFVIGLLLLLSILLAEYFLFDGSISGHSMIIVITSFSWLIYNKIPKKYAYERDLMFVLSNFSFVIVIIPHIFNKFFGLTFVSPILLCTIIFWMFYKNISNYDRERDFLLVFLNTLVIFFVFPRFFYDISAILGSDDFQEWFDSGRIVNMFLTRPLSGLLSFIGFNVWADGQLLYYEDLTTNKISIVSVAKQCSGLYSMGIFSAALISFMYVENKSLDKLAFLLLCTGLLVAYISNLIRMAVIVIVGHYWGIDALIWTHENLGWVIFTVWIALYWFLLDKFFIQTQ